MQTTDSFYSHNFEIAGEDPASKRKIEIEKITKKNTVEMEVIKRARKTESKHGETKVTDQRENGSLPALRGSRE
jgi:hypothetical protein